MGVVLGRLGQRRGQKHDAPGWTNGPGPTTCSDPNVITGAIYPNCPNKLFQFHHQPFNYYVNYAPGTPGRAHLQDEVDFVRAAKTGSSRRSAS